MNMNEVEVKIRGRIYKIAIEGLTPIEIVSLASQIEEKMVEIEKEAKTPDTSKIAVLTALHFASELYGLKQKFENLKGADEKKVDEMISKLKTTLDKKFF
jgi:cell division protein ZapA (FtsZ GTPase activity inhibitor)